MDIVSVRDAVALLKELRSSYQGQLDASVISRIDTLILDLEETSPAEAVAVTSDVSTRVLDVIANVIRMVTDVAELMQLFG